uniref:Uncharacterized protein n=1 Tax=Octopus bimaculoides TaxID=37653 RepID=A0A0L8H8T9_OCTBM
MRHICVFVKVYKRGSVYAHLCEFYNRCTEPSQPPSHPLPSPSPRRHHNHGHCWFPEK